MEFLKLHRRRSRLSDIAYIALNAGLAITLLIVMWSVQAIWLPLAIVLLSKWRIIAVRPRFWWQNILANMVDIIIGVSHVVFLYAANGVPELQIALTVGFIVWLLFVKPRSKRLFVSIQAAAALFAGTTALSMVVYGYDTIFFVAGMWAIGYVTARHVLVHYEFSNAAFFSLVWALVCAELAWFAHSWLFAYTLPYSADLKLSQLALIVTLLGFVADRALLSYHTHGEVRRSDLVAPSVFAISLTALMVVFFNQLTAIGGI